MNIYLMVCNSGEISGVSFFFVLSFFFFFLLPKGLRGSVFRFRSLITIRRLVTDYHIDYSATHATVFYTHDIFCVFFVIHTECVIAFKKLYIANRRKKRQKWEQTKQNEKKKRHVTRRRCTAVFYKYMYLHVCVSHEGSSYCIHTSRGYSYECIDTACVILIEKKFDYLKFKTSPRIYIYIYIYSRTGENILKLLLYCCPIYVYHL